MDPIILLSLWPALVATSVLLLLAGAGAAFASRSSRAQSLERLRRIIGAGLFVVSITEALVGFAVDDRLGGAPLFSAGAVTTAALGLGLIRWRRRELGVLLVVAAIIETFVASNFYGSLSAAIYLVAAITGVGGLALAAWPRSFASRVGGSETAPATKVRGFNCPCGFSTDETRSDWDAFVRRARCPRCEAPGIVPVA